MGVGNTEKEAMMAVKTEIEWCDSTFNPWIGCTRVGPGCDNCYAAVSTPSRAMGIKWGAGEDRKRTSASTWDQPMKWERNAQAFLAEHGRRQRVFCASLADVFDNEVPPAWRAELFALIAATPSLDWLVLTKRIGNVSKMIEAPGMQKCGLPPNVWIGATVVNQAEADRDIPKLLAVPARVRFLSVEPMLGPVNLRRVAPLPHDYERGSMWIDALRGAFTFQRGGASEPYFSEPAAGPINWVICGGESGAGARPMHPDWARSLRDQCEAAGVPFLFKQWGEWIPMMGHAQGVPVRGPKFTHPDGTIMGNAGKKAAGSLLDGREHINFPRDFK